MALQDQLHEAILYGDVGEVDSLLNQGADINTPTDNEIPLSTAILNGEIEVAVHLLQRGVDLSLPPLPGPETGGNRLSILNSWQPSRGTVMALQMMLGMAVSIAVSKPVDSESNKSSILRTFCRVLDCWVPWCVAVTAGSFGTLMALKERAAKIKETVFGGAILIAVLLCLLKATRQNSNRSRSEQNENGYPGLVILTSFLNSKFKSQKLALALLDAGLFSENYIREWKTTERCVLMQEDPLTTFWVTAATMGFDDVVHQLMNYGVPVDTPVFLTSTFNSMTLLAIAASYAQPRVVELLLECGANVDGETRITRESISPSTPLISCLLASKQYDKASSASRYQAVQLLIQAGANVKALHRSGESILFLAVKACSVDIVLLLLQHGVLPSPEEKQNGALLHTATCRRDAAEVLMLFSSEIGDVNARDSTGFTPLMRAAVEGKTAATQCLLTLGGDPRAKSQDGWTVLQLAASYGPKSLLDLLLNTGVYVNACEQETNTALFQACHRQEGRVDVLKLLLEKGADPNIPAGSWKAGSTSLHENCRCSSNSLGNPTDVTDQLEAAKLLILHGANVNAKYSVEGVLNETNVTPLGLAAAHASYAVCASVLQTLLEAGADPDGLSDMGLPALLTCCAHTCREINNDNIPDPVQILLDKGADTSMKDKNGRTPLHYAAAQHKSRATISILSRLDTTSQIAAANTQDMLGRTPLSLACADTHWMTLAAYKKWKKHQTPGNADYANFHISVESDLVLSTLRASDADPYLPDASGVTALHIAAKEGNPSTMAMLLQWGGPELFYDMTDRQGRLAFHYAVRSVEVTKMLLAYHLHGRVECREYFNVIELDNNSLATKLGVAIGMELLQQVYRHSHSCSEGNGERDHASSRRTGFNVPDQLGNTPLHYAALVGNHEVVELYLNMSDVEVAYQNKDGETALDFAREERCAAMIVRKCQDRQERNTTVKAMKMGERSRNRRKEAEDFVENLGEQDVWGVYERSGVDVTPNAEQEMV